MTNLVNIANDIKESVAPIMDRWVDDRVNMIMDLKSKVRNIEKDDQFLESLAKAKMADRYLSRSTFKFYWFKDMGYNKGDYVLACYDSEKYIREKMEKEAAAKLKKIDVAVAKKINFDVNSVEKLYFNTTGKDGYVEGAWKLNGEKVFSFDTLYAGGYNIQCLHIRTKYKLK